jgi:hypothetical protein
MLVENTKVKKKVYIGLGSLQAFIGLGAVGGGFMLVKDPSGSAMGLPMSFLEGAPFSDFLIPGIFLLAVNGLGSLIGAGLSYARRRYAEEITIVLGAILVAWIVMQVVIIRSFSWLQILYFILGVIELGNGLYIRQHRFKAA